MLLHWIKVRRVFLSFNIGKLLISTSNFEVINQIINLEVNGKLCIVRVVEEQVVNSFMQSICSCKCGVVFFFSKATQEV